MQEISAEIVIGQFQTFKVRYVGVPSYTLVSITFWKYQIRLFKTQTLENKGIKIKNNIFLPKDYQIIGYRDNAWMSRATCTFKPLHQERIKTLRFLINRSKPWSTDKLYFVHVYIVLWHFGTRHLQSKKPLITKTTDLIVINHCKRNL